MNLIEARLNKGLSRHQAAFQIGISRGTLVKAEEGVMPAEAQAKKIADFFGVKVTDIWPLNPSDPESSPPLEQAA